MMPTDTIFLLFHLKEFIIILMAVSFVTFGLMCIPPPNNSEQDI